MKKFCLGLTLGALSHAASAIVVTVDQPAAGATIQKGTGVPLIVTVKDHPRGSSLALFLRKNVPVRELPDTPGPDGAIMYSSHELHDHPTNYLHWNGKSFACTTGGTPGLCDLEVEPGNYRLEAIVYDEVNVNLALTPQEKGPHILARVLSGPFRVVGDPNNQHAQDNLWRGAVRALVTKFKLAVPTLPNWAWALEKDGAMLKSDNGEEYCQRFKLNPPFEGKLTVCGDNKARSGATKAGGQVGYEKGQLDFDQAKELASKTAETPYMSRVDYRRMVPNSPGSTYINVKLVDWSYRADKNYWVFAFELKKAGGNVLTRDQFADTLLIRVEKEGKACIGLLYPTGTSERFDFRQQELNCRL